LSDEFIVEPVLDQETVSDVDLLLLSWTQMVAVEMIAPDEEASAAKSDIAALLLTNYDITDLVMKQRTYEHYVIAYRENGTEKTMQIPIDEVESIYDL
jgi:hypothetical protein